jgi:hypothetical protein
LLRVRGGLLAGGFAGMCGIGGGVIIVPALLYLVKMKQLEALGTSLAALVPPVGLLGAIEYYRNGHINIQYAALVALGLAIGGYFGAKVIVSMPPDLVRKLYAVFLLIIGARMLIQGK